MCMYFKKADDLDQIMKKLIVDGIIFEYKLKDNRLKIVFQNEINKEKELVMTLFNKLEIEDIKFEEISIDKIIKRIYEN